MKGGHGHAGTLTGETCSDGFAGKVRCWSDRRAEFCGGTLYEGVHRSLKSSSVECPLAGNSSFGICWVIGNCFGLICLHFWNSLAKAWRLNEEMRVWRVDPEDT